MNPTDTAVAEAYSQQGMDLLAAGKPQDAIEAFRLAMAADGNYFEAYHGMIRAMREAGRAEQAIATALALIALTPKDPLAHTALSIALRDAGQIPEAEAAAGRARVLEWKMQLESPPDQNQGNDLDLGRDLGKDLAR